MRVNYAIVFVSDMKRAVSFYRDVLGLPLKFESPGWTEFATDGRPWRSTQVKGPILKGRIRKWFRLDGVVPASVFPISTNSTRGWSRGMCPAFRSRGRFLELGSHSTGVRMGCRYPSVRSRVKRDIEKPSLSKPV